MASVAIKHVQERTTPETKTYTEPTMLCHVFLAAALTDYLLNQTITL
ncbi:hypothetical protein [Xenorhabdus bovienii]|nr:hypothetical protein [Xenorhabdus bovienii]MDE9452443.1 hypothetical protein [Xenorhabdus bovienii]MDE9482562.1 hypothetical protein [Xenorhabdus bovienii]